MAATQWETCSAEALLREFFAQDDLSRLAEGAGALLGCPLLVLDDTFHVAAHHLPLGFSDAVFQASVRSGDRYGRAGRARHGRDHQALRLQQSGGQPHGQRQHRRRTRAA